jgi:glycosidase
MLKEIVIPLEDRDDIYSITIGVFPVNGRFYRKKMIKKDAGFYVELDLSIGITYYSLYLNDDLSTEYINLNTPLRGQNLAARIPIILKSEIFTHLYFINNPTFFSCIYEDLVELKAISYYSWINQVKLVNEELQEFDFSIIYEYRNIKYWNLRYKKGVQKKFALKFGNNDKQYWLSKNLQASLEFNSTLFFKFLVYKRKQKYPFSFNIGYQIFPDTFCRSKLQNNNTLFLANNEKSTNHFYGGDINGIIEKIDLVSELGFDFIYLNPIFHAGSNHRYDTIDYLRIDPILGTLEDFKRLVKKLHLKKIKIILDISLNHCSVNFYAFKDLLKLQEKSIYHDWYIIDYFPVSLEKANYSCWHGIRELPQFNLKNLEVQDYLIKSSLFWMKEMSIDGWRIDVSNEIPKEFMQTFIKFVKNYKEDILLIGENLHDDSNDFVNKLGADGITSYGLYRDIFKEYFLEEGLTLRGLVQNLMEYNYTHSFWAIQNSWNFLSNHDLPRFYSILANKKNYWLAITLLFVLPGSPVLYYGEELMISGTSEDNRCPINWHKYNVTSSVYKYLKLLINIRNVYWEIFKLGNIEIKFVDEVMELIVFARKYNMNKLLFILNFSENEQIFNYYEFIGDHNTCKIIKGNSQDQYNLKIAKKDTNIIFIEC